MSQRLEQQRATGYPTFPGNVEALSMPSGSSERSIAYTPSTSVTPASPQQSDRTKRKQTLAACRPCRKRKSKCDGARPGCKTCTDKATPCVYSVEEGKTQQQASREELKAYRTVVRMLRKASSTEALLMLKHLRDHEDVNEAVKFIQADTALHGCPTSSKT